MSAPAGLDARVAPEAVGRGFTAIVCNPLTLTEERSRGLLAL